MVKACVARRTSGAPNSRRSGSQSAQRLVVLLGSIALARCAPLPPIAENECGNAALDPNEACDTYVAAGLTCGEAGRPHECRYLCDPGVDRALAACPTGEGCGLDGICRHPSGTFERPVVRGDGADELGAADLDGDGRVDLLSSKDQEFAILFGAADDEQPADLRQALEPLFLPEPASWPAGRGADLLVSRFGVASVRVTGSGATRRLDTAEQPFVRAPGLVRDLMPASLECAGNWKGEGMVLHATVATASLPAFHALVFSPDFSMQFLGPTLRGPADLSGPMLTEPLDERPESPCKELVLGYRGETFLELFDPFRLVGGVWQTVNCPFPFLNCPADAPLRLAVGAPVQGGPFAARLNPQDQHLDLVVEVQVPDTADCAPCFELRAAYGVGDGTFHSDPANVPLSAGDNAFSALGWLTNDDGRLLAMGDLDGDGLADYVFQRSVRSSVTGARVTTNLGAPWQEALVADFNGNTYPDLLAADATNSQLSFFNGTKEGVLTESTIVARGPASQLRVGDFDGDLLLDAALVVHGVRRESHDPEGVDELSVLFGQPSGAPSAPVSIGRSTQEQRLALGRMASSLVSVFAAVEDAATDILAVSSSPSGALTISAFVGRADRELRSAVGLVDTREVSELNVSLQPFIPRRVVAGRFAPYDPSQGDQGWRVATLALPATKATVSGDYQMWLAPDLGTTIDVAALTLVPEAIQTQATTAASAVWELGMTAAIDLDVDDWDEFVAVAPTIADGAKSVYRIGDYDVPAHTWRWLPAGDTGALDLPLYRKPGPTVPCRDPYEFPDPAARDCVKMNLATVAATTFDLPEVNGRMRACDVVADAAGAMELVVLSRPALVRDDPGELDVHASLRVFVPDGNLSLSADRWLPIAGLESVQPRDFACLQADGDSELELAVLGKDELWLLNGGVQNPELTLIPLDNPTSYARLAAGDVDGDGLDDIVLAGQTEIAVLHGREAPLLGATSQ